VGTGFHADLSGRENIFLNGAILGMSKAEIRSKLDEIIAFAEIEKFIDTPVKRYSSGMYVRLAFAVAAHLEPEILIVDEVLAVGDAEFQKKCIGKMQEVSRGGRTVLFVSHQMEAVDRLTSSCVWLQNGSVLRAGTTGAIISDYLNASRSHDGLLSSYRVQSIANSVEIQTVKTLNNLGQPQTVFRQGENISIVLEVNAFDKKTFDVAIVVENDRDQALFASHYSDNGDAIDAIGKTTLTVTITPAVLRRGKYRVSLAVYTPDKLEFYDVIHHFPLFEIAGTADKSFPDDIRWGDLYFQLPWKKH
jgi:lipopolysaccharide transport system ATP-binding protein